MGEREALPEAEAVRAGVKDSCGVRDREGEGVPVGVKEPPPWVLAEVLGEGPRSCGEGVVQALVDMVGVPLAGEAERVMESVPRGGMELVLVGSAGELLAVAHELPLARPLLAALREVLGDLLTLPTSLPLRRRLAETVKEGEGVREEAWDCEKDVRDEAVGERGAEGEGDAPSVAVKDCEGEEVALESDRVAREVSVPPADRVMQAVEVLLGGRVRVPVPLPVAVPGGVAVL